MTSLRSLDGIGASPDQRARGAAEAGSPDCRTRRVASNRPRFSCYRVQLIFERVVALPQRRPLANVAVIGHADKADKHAKRWARAMARARNVMDRAKRERAQRRPKGDVAALVMVSF